MRRLLGILSIIILLGGCSSTSKAEIQEIKQSDLCVTHVKMSEKICYGDVREKVEQIAGLTTDAEPNLATGYKDGLMIMYRDNKVAAIKLRENSLGVYKTEFGSIGERRSILTDRLGTSSAVSTTPLNLDYFYDSQSKNFMKTLEYKGTHEEMEKVYIMSFMFDQDEQTNTILFTDMKMGAFMY